jgi:Ca2+-binding RTX toxin-like protein
MRRMSPIARIAAILLIPAAVALVAADSSARTPPGRPVVICAYAEGPKALRVDADGEFNLEFIRDGSRIAVEAEGRNIPCSGGTPTVLNVDRILVSDLGLSVTINESEGRFAPGASGEPRGSEIEFWVTISGSGYGALRVTGTSGPDHITLGTRGPGTVAANLNVAADGRTNQDSDVVVRIGDRPGQALINARAGSDRIRSRDRTGLLGRLKTDLLYVRGNSGSDLITGTRGEDLLFGDEGADGIIAGAGADRLVPGLGNDRAFAGGGADRIDLSSPGRKVKVPDAGNDFADARAGNDFVESRDARGDRILCGLGIDRARADHRDKLGGCERR